MREAIMKRLSVRSYEKRPLSYKDEAKVQEILESVGKKEGPFGHHVQFFSRLNKDGDQTQFGTYGFIKHPPMFIGGVIKNSLEGMVDYGFLFEEVVLRLTDEGLGTVWLGGTFDRTAFQVKVGFNEVLPAVSPVGYPADASMRATLENGVKGSRRRKPFGTLFFSDGTLKPLSKDHPFRPYLEAVRSAPSASNKQPWRFVVDNETFHLYLKRMVKPESKNFLDTQAIDAGIALSHLCLSLNEDGHETGFKRQSPMDISEWDYIVSVTMTPKTYDTPISNKDAKKGES